jgi:cation:H+ antiporter
MPTTSHENQLKLSLSPPPVKEIKNLEYYIGSIGLSIILVCLGLKKVGFDQYLLFNIIMIIGAILLLVAASNVVLENAVKLAESLGVSELVIGLTIVSIGTSIPEIFTCIISAIRDVGAFAVGDIYGSYVTQLTFILGLVILIIPKDVNRSFAPHILRDGGLVIISIIILTIQVADGYISRWEAVFSMTLFLGYIIYLYRTSSNDEEVKIEELHNINEMEQDMGIHANNAMNPGVEPINYEAKSKPTKKQLIGYLCLVLLGTLMTYLGADMVVTSGVTIARSLDVSEHIIASTIVGAGTAIPEMAVSVNAARRQKPDIAFGNLLGSNVVDPLFSVAIGVLIKPIVLTEFAVEHILLKTFPIALFVVASIILMFSRKRGNIASGMLYGLFLVGIYILFLFFAFA